VPAKLRHAYARAGRLNKRQRLDQGVSLLGYHRKAAFRALRARPAGPRPPAFPGRPRTYHPERLLPTLKPIWFAALQPCGLQVRALLPEWLPACEADPRRPDADLRHRARPGLLTQRRPWPKNDNAHVEQQNRTRVQEHFGRKRYDNPKVTPRIHALCAGALGQQINHFLPTLKLE
jgi:hypothetical protein